MRRFFLYVIIELSAPRAATTRQDIENLVAPWRSTAEQCRSAISRLSSSANRELVKALSITAEYFESEAIFAEEDANNPFMLKRRSGKPEDNSVRGRVRALAWITIRYMASSNTEFSRAWPRLRCKKK